MKKKIVGLLVCMLLIATMVLPVAGTMNFNSTTTNVKHDICKDENQGSDPQQTDTRGNDFDWQISGNNVFTAHGGSYPSGNVGIGTASPLVKFQVIGRGWFKKDVAYPSFNLLYLENTNSSSYSNALALLGGGGAHLWYIGNDLNRDKGRNFYVRDNQADQTRMFIDSNGFVGFGTTSPTEKLDVEGTTRMTGFKMTTGATDGYVLTSDGSGVGTWQEPAGGGISGSGTNNYIPKFTAATTLGDSAIYESSGNIGIGTTSPSSLLHVDGGTGVVAEFSGRVKGADAVNDDEFVTKSQIDSVSTAHFTPSGTMDPNGNVGDTAWDDNFFYVKTPSGWKHAALETWNIPMESSFT